MKKPTPIEPTQETDHASGAAMRTDSGLAVGPDIQPWVHGRYSTYTVRGCRCALCRAANSAYKSKRQRAERAELKKLKKLRGKAKRGRK
jgi:hypothetical protein